MNLSQFEEIGLSLIIENLKEGIVLIDNDFKVIFINQEAQSILGYSEKQIKKISISSLFDKEIYNEITSIYNEPKTKLINDIKIKDIFGNSTFLSIYINPIINYTHKKEHVDYILIQLSDLEGISLLSKKSKLDDEEKIMSQLFHGLAHEIKNTLSGIKGAAQLISQIKSNDKEISDCCSIIDKEASRLSSLVDTFRLLQPSDETNYEVVDINEIIKSTISICFKGSSEKDIRVSFDSISDISKVYGFKELLNIVFMNIIKNAFEAIDIKGSIKINIRHLKDYKINNKNFIVTEISDDGLGIKKESINNLFKPFFSTKKKGQGIGLFLSQKIVNKIGGFIEAESSNNKTTFKIFLPDASQ